MFHNSKKGFTIVELVVVIAVVAVLAAVLIPTFAGLINKANQSADQQAVTNMNKILATENKAEDVNGVIEILIKNNYAGDLSTYFAGYSLAWIEEKNVIVLVENDKIVYPDAYVDGGYTFELINPMVSDADSLKNGFTDGSVVVLGNNVDVEKLNLAEAGTYTLNLAGNTLSSQTERICIANAGTKLVISNGIIDTTANSDYYSFLVDSGATVEVNNVTINSASGMNPIQCCSSTMVLNNVTATQLGNNTTWPYLDAAITVANNYYEEDGEYHITDLSQLSHLTVNGGNYTGEYGIYMQSTGGTVVINDGTFIGTTNALRADCGQNYASDGAKHSVTINGGYFNGAITIAEGVTCIINGGTFSNTSLALDAFQAYVAADKTVVENADGTWTVK